MKNLARFDMPLVLQRLALILFILFPVTLALIAQILSLARSWDPLKVVQIGLLVAVFLIPILAIFANPSLWASLEKRPYLLVIWVLAIAIGLRIVLIPLISTDFVTDMEDIHLFASDVYAGHPFANLKNYPNIPQATYLTLTGYVLSFVYKIFGASTTVAKMFLVALSALTTWLVYLTGREVGGVRTGFVASLLYATLPSLVCYTGVLAGDHLALPLLVLAVLIYARLFKRELTYYSLIGYALCGVVIGLVDWFRPVGMVLLVALGISVLTYQLRRRAFFQVALALIVLVISYAMVSKLSITITENIFHIKILSASQRIGAYLFVGLNPESHGGVTLDDARIIGETFQRYGVDYRAANRYLIQSAFKRLDQGELAKLLIEKFDLIWSSHIALFDYAQIGSNDQELIYLLADIESLLYLAMTLFLLVGAVAYLFRDSHPAIMTMQLFLIGFGILMLALEAQNRYTVIVLPYLILLGALGMKEAFLPGFFKFRQELQSQEE
jgi:4-amino-4-deoxy-L-arabinose transferase-like glycosyltransferase